MDKESTGQDGELQGSEGLRRQRGVTAGRRPGRARRPKAVDSSHVFTNPWAF